VDPRSLAETAVSVLQHLNTKNMLYGYVGFQDYTLYPLIRPGSFCRDQTHGRTGYHGSSLENDDEQWLSCRPFNGTGYRL